MPLSAARPARSPAPAQMEHSGAALNEELVTFELSGLAAVVEPLVEERVSSVPDAG